jgi:hypothetical protein
MSVGSFVPEKPMNEPTPISSSGVPSPASRTLAGLNRSARWPEAFLPSRTASPTLLFSSQAYETVTPPGPFFLFCVSKLPSSGIGKTARLARARAANMGAPPDNFLL